MKQNQNKKPLPLHVQFSKMCSYLLRHGAKNEGLAMRPDGFVEVEEFLLHPKIAKFKANLKVLKDIVEKNDKKRFELAEITENEQTKLYIRAVQGHTIEIDDELLLEKINEPYQMIVHGTYFDAWQFIKDTGLKAMARNHVHFAIGLKGDKQVISGMRGNCEVYIEVDMAKAMAEGMVFYLSKNKVVLSAGFDKVIPPKYFKKVTDCQGKVLLEQN